MKLKALILSATVVSVNIILAQFAPQANVDGTTAIHKDSSIIINWASEVISFDPGFQDIANPDGPLASFGTASESIGMVEGTSADVVSLGDGGSITLTFPYAIRNGVGFDFAVFENSFAHDYLELAHVEVSTDGVRFVRIPSFSNVDTESQTGSFDSTDPTLVHNLAGKYIQGFGTPFDLNDVIDSTGIDVNDINFVKIVDVVGSIDSEFGSVDSEGHIINDPYPTDFESGGFDLDGVGVINDKSHTLNSTEQMIEPIQIYPNPTNGIININLVDSPIQEILLIDYLGKIVFRGDQSVINLSHLQIDAGIYLMRIIDINGNSLQKRVVYKP